MDISESSAKSYWVPMITPVYHAVKTLKIYDTRQYVSREMEPSEVNLSNLKSDSWQLKSKVQSLKSNSLKFEN